MKLLIIGLVLFFLLHLLPTVPAGRSALTTRWGEQRYKGVFSLLSAVALVLIAVGYAVADKGAQLFAPVATARAIAPYAMCVAFILLASSHSPSHIPAAVKHPMLIGVLIWGAVHLLANGDLRGSVLFGAFAAYAVVDLISALQRGAVASFTPTLRGDVISILAGTLIALLVMTFHRALFGAAVVGFGL